MRPTEPQIEIVLCSTPAELAVALPAWMEFAARDATSCGFWCDPAVVSEMAGLAQGQSLILATVCRDGGRLAMLPFKMSVGPVPLFVGLFRVGSVRARSLRLYDYEFAVEAGHDRPEILAGVLSAFSRERTADVVLADNCVLDDQGGRVAWRHSGVALRNRQPTYVVDMPSDFDAYLSSLSSNTRQILRRRVRKMQKECGDTLHARCFRNEDEMEELLKHLSAVWESSWHGRLNRQPPPALPFLRRIAREGLVRSYVLFAGDSPAASVLGFQYKGKFSDEAPAYDDRWKSLSPGLVLNYFIIEDLFRSDPPRTVDFGFGYNQYKEMLGTRREVRGQLWMPITMRGRALVSGMKACDGIYGLGKRVPGSARAIRGMKARLQQRR